MFWTLRLQTLERISVTGFGDYGFKVYCIGPYPFQGRSGFSGFSSAGNAASDLDVRVFWCSLGLSDIFVKPRTRIFFSLSKAAAFHRDLLLLLHRDWLARLSRKPNRVYGYFSINAKVCAAQEIENIRAGEMAQAQSEEHQNWKKKGY